MENYNKIIKTEQEYLLAVKEIDRIFDAKPGTPEGDRFELLSILIEKYEEKNVPIGPPDPIEAIKFRMDQIGISTTELGEILGCKVNVSELLSRKKKLTLSMMRKLHNQLGIAPEVLIMPY